MPSVLFRSGVLAIVVPRVCRFRKHGCWYGRGRLGDLKRVLRVAVLVLVVEVQSTAEVFELVRSRRV